MHFRSEHDDVLSGENSFVYGKSTGNQRIEAFWGQLRKQCIQFWMDFFKDMYSMGLLNMCDRVDALLLRDCFLDVLCNDLDQMRSEKNVNRIRKKGKRKLRPKDHISCIGVLNCSERVRTGSLLTVLK